MALDGSRNRTYHLASYDEAIAFYPYLVICIMRAGKLPIHKFFSDAATGQEIVSVYSYNLPEYNMVIPRVDFDRCKDIALFIGNATNIIEFRSEGLPGLVAKIKPYVAQAFSDRAFAP
jgi:hypothetical protein